MKRQSMAIFVLLFVLAATILTIDHTRESVTTGLAEQVLAGSEQTVQAAQRQPALDALPWVFTGGPVGGLGYDVRMDAADPNVMYVTDALSGVFKSLDGGKSWTAKNQGITTRMGTSGDAIPVFSLTIDPNDGSRIWAGTQYNSNAYLSEDGGASWKAYNNGIAEEFLSIRGFAVEPGSSNVVYLAAEVSSWEWNTEPLPGLGLDKTKGVVYKTTNGGQNWTKIWEGDNLARYVWIHPQDHNLIYVSTGIFDREAANSDAATKTPGGVGVLRSLNGGQTWEALDEANGFDAKELYIGSLYMHPTEPNILLAASGNDPYTTLLNERLGGVYRTQDGGDNWTEVLDGMNFSVVEICEGDPDVAYAGGLDGFFRSEDGGKTWVQVGGLAWGPPGIIAGFPIDIQCDPRDALRLFVNNYGGGNYLSTDGGVNWVVSSDGYSGGIMSAVAVSPTYAAQLFATARSGVFTSRDGGRAWAGLNNGVARWMEMVALGVDTGNPNHLLISNADFGPTPIESHDGGRSWAFIQTGLTYPPGSTLVRIVFAPNNPQLIYASVAGQECVLNGRCEVAGGGLMVSRDGGDSWEKTALDTGSILGIDVFAGDSKTAYAAVVDGGLYRTGNSGQTWEPVNANPGYAGQTVNEEPEPVILATLAIDPHNVEKLYAGFRSGSLMVSNDGGKSWAGPAAGIPPESDIVALAVDVVDTDIVYAGSADSGMFVSLDGGGSWKTLNDGLRMRAVRDLSLSADGTVLYAATDGGGIFRLGTPQTLNFLPVVRGD